MRRIMNRFRDPDWEGRRSRRANGQTACQFERDAYSWTMEVRFRASRYTCRPSPHSTPHPPREQSWPRFERIAAPRRRLDRGGRSSAPKREHHSGGNWSVMLTAGYRKRSCKFRGITFAAHTLLHPTHESNYQGQTTRGFATTEQTSPNVS